MSEQQHVCTCGYGVQYHPHPVEADRPGEGPCLDCPCRRFEKGK